MSVMAETVEARLGEGLSDRELSLLYARIDDLLDGREKGVFGSTDFLTPRDRKRAERYLTSCGQQDGVRFYGGFPEAERCVAIFLPAYLTDAAEDFGAYTEEAFRSYAEET